MILQVSPTNQLTRASTSHKVDFTLKQIIYIKILDLYGLCSLNTNQYRNDICALILKEIPRN